MLGYGWVARGLWKEYQGNTPHRVYDRRPMAGIEGRGRGTLGKSQENTQLEGK